MSPAPIHTPLDHTPLDEWPPGWLTLEVAALSQNHLYIIMTDKEKHEAGLPVTVEQMREYIRGHHRK